MPYSTTTLSGTPSLKHDTSETNISQARDEFATLLGREAIISSPDECFARSNTRWSSASPSQIADLILFPTKTSDVSAIMRICSQRRIPVTAYSGGTSFHGALAATRRGICIDFKQMNQIISVHAEDMDVVVQPAVGWQDLNDHLNGQGLFFPPDPGPGAQIGGMIRSADRDHIAMNCSGTNAYRHGTMKAWVISMTIVLADGSIVKTGHRPRKSSAGYDLASLIVGSEGTLGLVTEAVLKVTSVPQNLHVAVATFPTTQQAVKAAVALIGSSLPIDALELIDRSSMKAINQSRLSDKCWQENPTLFMKFSGSEQAVQSQVELAREESKKSQCSTFELATEKTELEALWAARKSVGVSLHAMKKDPTDLFLSADAAVPISRLADMIEETHQVIADAGLLGSTLGHVGDGNFHAVIICSEGRKEIAEQIIAHIQRRAVQLEGTITGEHGIGLGLRDMLLYELGENAVNMMRAIKLALDPQCILNCDKVIRLENTD